MARVTGPALVQYVTTLRDEYERSVEGAIPKRYQSSLMRYRLKDRVIVALLSRTWGAGYTYSNVLGRHIALEVRDPRIECLVFGVPPEALEHAAMGLGKGSTGCVLRGLNYRNRIPVRLDAEETGVTLQGLHIEMREGMSSDTVKVRELDVALAEISGSRSMDQWSLERATGTAKDEVISALVDIRGFEQRQQRQQLSLEDFLSQFHEKHVVLLGDFSGPGRARLQVLHQSLTSAGYLPFTLDEILELPEYDLRQKLAAVANVCRFVVVDDSSKAGQLMELGVVEHLRVIVLVVRQIGASSSYVSRAMSATSKVIREMEYDNVNQIADVLPEGLEWCEDTKKRLRAERVRAYPWRGDLAT